MPSMAVAVSRILMPLFLLLGVLVVAGACEDRISLNRRASRSLVLHLARLHVRAGYFFIDF